MSGTTNTTSRSTAATGTAADLLEPLLSKIFRGTIPLGFHFWDGTRAGPDSATTIGLHSPMAIRRLLWAPGELGLARAYVAGDIDVDGDVFDLLALADSIGDDTGNVTNAGMTWKMLPDLARVAYRLGVLGGPPAPPNEEARLHGRRHALGRDAAAISHHYDVGNAFYRLVLGESMTYSCGYWADDSFDLADAETAKYELVCRKLDLQPGERLLDVGCGWGGMAIHAARNHGVRVVGITLSREQAEYGRTRVADAGLEDRVEIRVQDYRDIHDGPFDAISSIGMFEHVGLAKTKEYLTDLHELLRPQGRLLNHAISRPAPDGHPGVAPNSFMARYVFPDAALLEVGTLVSAMQSTRLEVRDVESLREHYAKTLRNWITNLEENWDEAQKLVGPARARIWRLYMAGSADGFERNHLAIHQVLAVRTDNAGVSGVAPTRERLDLTHPLPEHNAELPGSDRSTH